MRIELEWTLTPEDMGEPYPCAICGDSFELGTVTAWTRDIPAFNPCACPACVEALGEYRPDRFPTIEEYRKLEAQWPTPQYASGEEADVAWIAEFEEWKRREANC
jgi:hypothetical protein